MTPTQFEDWMAAMAVTAGEAAALLDVHRNTITRFRRDGGPKMLYLACVALYRRDDRPLPF